MRDLEKLPKLVNLSTLIDPYIEDLRLRGDKPELNLITFPRLNEAMWGLNKSALTIIGARPSHGKSDFAIHCALDLAMQGKTILFLSLEMESLKILRRVVANRLRINNADLRSSRSHEYLNQISALKEELFTKKFLISDCIGKTWKEVDDLLTITNQKQRNIDAIFLDYIQNTRVFGDNREAYNEYIQHFRELAIRYNFAGVLVSQINRESQQGKEKRPYLHHLKGTGFLDEHSDFVILLNYPHKYDKSISSSYYEIFLEKNKEGGNLALRVKYSPQFSYFEEMEKEIKPPTVPHEKIEEMFAGKTYQVQDWED